MSGLVSVSASYSVNNNISSLSVLIVFINTVTNSTAHKRIKTVIKLKSVLISAHENK